MRLARRLRSTSYIAALCLLLSCTWLTVFITQNMFGSSKTYYPRLQPDKVREDRLTATMSSVKDRLNEIGDSGKNRTGKHKVTSGSFDLEHVLLTKEKNNPTTETLSPAAGGAPTKHSYADQQVANMLTELTKRNEKFLVIKKQDSYLKFLRNDRKLKKRKGFGLPVYRNYKGYSNWEKFHMGIDQYALYDPADPAIGGLLRDLSTLPIVDVEQKKGGTQLKLIFIFNDEGHALFKPMRFSRETETLINHFYFSDFERHTAEIAAFHLDRLLGFYRIPPTAGRVVNITHDIKRLATNKLAKTFFISPANNICFHGTCSYYCDTNHAICGNPDTIEGSFAAFLPPSRIVPRQTWRNPWSRSYSKHRKAYWEVYDDLCEKIRYKPLYSSGRRLLDIMDMHIFDFLTGNLDRHHYETIEVYGNNTFLLHFDNGRGFGRQMHDEMSILAPITQCCLIRHSTFVKLGKLYSGPDKLSDMMRTSLSADDLTPILTDLHLKALDRRVNKILVVIVGCLQTKNYTDVIVDDHL
ncbi:extracellular serine/threonine protein kinase FAM20C-like [Gigantopelta aegis]|uniref:extracellular serine/threonine protein kinase FAM20C-like n=1 Tax=Gigantopelta aegis TaxID=1735272 RepID=UPI001B88E783|nr:extracellular serine/threonine protein kinase FAM20C-like [Gigantopelta aegis]